MDFGEYVKLVVWAAGVAFGTFAVSHQAASPAFNRRLGQLMHRADATSWFGKLPGEFSEIVDALFGAKLFSWRALFVSTVASVSALTLVLGLFLLLEGISIQTYWEPWSRTASSYGYTAVAVPLAFLFFGNLLPDYLSIVESRYLIRRLGGGSGRIRLIGVLVLDLMLTALVFCIFISVSMFVEDSIQAGLRPDMGSRFNLESFINLLSLGFSFPSTMLGLNIDHNQLVTFERPAQFFTTFATSLWLWLYILTRTAGWTGARFLAPLWDKVVETLDVDHKPLLALGWMAGAGTVVIAIALAPFVAG